MKRIVVKDILWLFILTRLFLVLLTYVTFVLFTAPRYSSTPVNVAALLMSWNHWDASNYVRIAQYGYHPVDLAFFPLFPLLISAISHILGSWSYLLVGTLISNLALLGTLFIIYHLAQDHFNDEIARRTLLYLCIFPTALFFFAAYNESLYLFFTVGAFLAIQRQRWWLAGLLGLLAALTRSAGILLVIPYLYEVWIHYDLQKLLTHRKLIRSNIRSVVFALLPILLIPLGMVFYALFCWRVVGNPLAFITVQEHAGRHIAWPWVGMWNAFSKLLWNTPKPFGSSNEAHILLNLSATIGFITLIVLGWGKVRTSYSIWMVFLLLYFLSYPALQKPDMLLSNQRFVLEMFPAFITLAILGKQHVRLHQGIMLLFPVLLAVLSMAFVMNLWVV